MVDGIDASRFGESLQGHVAELGLRYTQHGQDWVELAFDYNPRFAIMPDSGILSSGPIVSLIDSASGLAIMVKIKRYRPLATLDLRVDYMRASPPGRTIIARATCYHVARNVAFVRCEAHDGDPDDLVALSMSSFFFTAE